MERFQIWYGHLKGNFAQPARLIAELGERRAQPIVSDPGQQPESSGCTRLVQMHRIKKIKRRWA